MFQTLSRPSHTIYLLVNFIIRLQILAVTQVQREATPDPFAERWTALATERLIEGNEQHVENK